MPVSAGTVQFSYTGDGTTTVFPFPSRFLSNSDIIVGVDGVPVTTGFTVTGQGAEVGGNVTFAAAPTTGQAITLIRAPAINQLLDFVNNQTVLAQNIDNGLDKLTIVAQYLNYLLERTLRLDQFDTGLTGDFDVGMRRLKNVDAPVDATDAARLSDLQGVVAGTGNVPSPTIGQIGYALKAIAAGVFGWVSEGNPLAPDGTLAAPGYGFASETNTGFLRPSAGVLQAAVLGVLRAELSATAFRLLVPLLATNATVTAGTNAQGQAPLTADQNTVTVAAANPSGVTLPTAVAGRWVTVVNRGANPVNIYPATGAAIGALAANAPLLLGVGQVVEFFARSTTQWETQLSQPLDADLTAIAGLTFVRGDLIRRGVSALERLTPTAARQVAMFDGTDVVFANTISTQTAVTPSGVTFVDLTGIPATAQRVTVMILDLSLTGTDAVAFQLGTTASVESTGYGGASSYSAPGNSAGSQVNGSAYTINIGANNNNAAIRSGSVVFQKMTGNSWMATGSFSTAAPIGCFFSGVKTLAGTLTRVRVLSTGANTFDGGSIVISWE